VKGLLKGRQEDSPALARARRRVAKLGTTELLEWADTAVTGAGRAFSDYRREEQAESLLEIREALPALAALVDELILRNEAANS
jgi:hypothetical protein